MYAPGVDPHSIYLSYIYFTNDRHQLLPVMNLLLFVSNELVEELVVYTQQWDSCFICMLYFTEILPDFSSKWSS